MIEAALRIGFDLYDDSTARSGLQFNTECPLCRSRTGEWTGKFPRKRWGCAHSATESCQVSAEREDQSMKLRPDNARGCAAAAIVLILGLTSGCSGSSDATESSSSGPTTTSTASSVSSLAPTSPSEVVSTSASSVSASQTATSQPWPATFTPDQSTDAVNALDVFRNAVRLQDEVYQDPGMSDIHTFLRPYIVDPWSTQVEIGAQKMAAGGRHLVGFTVVDGAQVTAYEGNKISIQACLDSSQTDLLNADGQSVKASLPVGDRVQTTGNVYLYPPETSGGGGWFLSEVDTPQPYQPC